LPALNGFCRTAAYCLESDI